MFSYHALCSCASKSIVWSRSTFFCQTFKSNLGVTSYIFARTRLVSGGCGLFFEAGLRSHVMQESLSWWHRQTGEFFKRFFDFQSFELKISCDVLPIFLFHRVSYPLPLKMNIVALTRAQTGKGSNIHYPPPPDVNGGKTRLIAPLIFCMPMHTSILRLCFPSIVCKQRSLTFQGQVTRSLWMTWRSFCTSLWLCQSRSWWSFFETSKMIRS